MPVNHILEKSIGFVVILLTVQMQTWWFCIINLHSFPKKNNLKFQTYRLDLSYSYIYLIILCRMLIQAKGQVRGPMVILPWRSTLSSEALTGRTWGRHDHQSSRLTQMYFCYIYQLNRLIYYGLPLPDNIQFRQMKMRTARIQIGYHTWEVPQLTNSQTLLIIMVLRHLKYAPIYLN